MVLNNTSSNIQTKLVVPEGGISADTCHTNTSSTNIVLLPHEEIYSNTLTQVPMDLLWNMQF